MNIVEMPKLSDTMTTGTLVKWLKQEGDAVKNGDMLAEVETDKATMELECFFDGTLLKIFAPAGSQVEIGAPLCAVGNPGEKVEEGGRRPPGAGNSTADVVSRRPEVGGHPETEPQPTAEPAAPSENVPSPTASAASSATDVASRRPEVGGHPETTRVRISPLARKLAQQKGLDPSQLKGTGPDGRITEVDVIAAATKGPAAPQPRETKAAPAEKPAPAPQPREAQPAPDGNLLPVSNMRATMARRLVESKTKFPHFYLEAEIDAGPLVSLRANLNNAAEGQAVKLSVNDFILKASAEALRQIPIVNRSWQDNPVGIHQHKSSHVSFAVALEDGLITPVIRDAQSKSLLEISRQARQLADLARERKLEPAQYTGGTFCVSNLGMKGIERFYAIINPPNAAILAVGAIVKKPIVKDDQIDIGHRLSLSLSCDHRVVTGAEGADFLAALRHLLENPTLLLF